MNLYSNKNKLPFTEKQGATVKKRSQPRSQSDLQVDYVSKKLTWLKTVNWNLTLLASSVKQDFMLLASKCEEGPCVTCFKVWTRTLCYLLQSVKKDPVLLASKCEPGLYVSCFKIWSGTKCYLLWSGKWDCALLASKTTTLKLGHEMF
jgi:hypothetical protein